MNYIDADKFAKHIKIGSPVIFDSATINEIIFVLDTEPRVDAEPVTHAHWIDTPNYWKCSNCGETYWSMNREFIYCPHCGAKMDEEVGK
jgi:Zn finger protein HypA/HybF involved in hydrogenase expression